MVTEGYVACQAVLDGTATEMPVDMAPAGTEAAADFTNDFFETDLHQPIWTNSGASFLCQSAFCSASARFSLRGGLPSASNRSPVVRTNRDKPRGDVLSPDRAGGGAPHTAH